MKTCNALLVFTVCFVALTSSVSAQSGYKDYAWTESPTKTELPAKYSNEDAVYTYYERRFAVAQDFTTYYTTHTKVKILTQRGLDNFARIVLTAQNDYAYLETVDARTIKANGQVVDLNAADIKKLKLRSNDLIDEADLVIFPIPGVEVGDEVEMISIIRNAFPTPYFFMHTRIPIIKANYSLRLPKEMVIDLMVYNGMQQPTVVEKANFNTYTWVMDTLPGFGDDTRAIKSLTLPFILQSPKFGKSMSLTGDTYEWKDFITRIKKMPFTDSQYTVEHTTKEVLDYVAKKLPGDTSIAKRVNAIQTYLNDSTIARYGEKGEKGENKNGISYFGLCKVYIAVFEELNIPYYALLARNKYNGPFDYKIAEWVQVDETMFAYKDEKGNLGIVTPRGGNAKYQLNEIDVRYQGTEAIVINATNLSVGRLTLPSGSINDNNRIRRAQMNVNLEKMGLSGKIQESFRGSFSTYFRKNYLKHSKDGDIFTWMKELMHERNEKVTVDTAYLQNLSQGTDNQFKVTSTVSIPTSVIVLDNKLYSISMENWFWHGIDQIETEKRSLAYYPLITGSDIFRYYLVFDHKVELINKSNIDLLTSYPEYGQYQLSAVQVDPNTILVESNYTLSGKPFPANELSKFSDIKKAIDKADKEQLIVKVVD